MQKITDLGFQVGVISEAIVSTCNKDGTSNAAPMGITIQNDQQFSLNVFNSSSTNRNLQTNKCGVINLTSNIEVFYKTAFKEANPDGKLPQDWFIKSEAVNAPKLRFADATVNFSVSKMEPISPDKTQFLCSVELVTAQKKPPQVYCRGMSATLEAIIHATRVKAFIGDAAETERVSKLLEMIQNCNDVVERVAPNSQYSTVMADLMKRIDSWRRKA
jgi:uncharacterized protein